MSKVLNLFSVLESLFYLLVIAAYLLMSSDKAGPASPAHENINRRQGGLLEFDYVLLVFLHLFCFSSNSGMILKTVFSLSTKVVCLTFSSSGV